MKIFLAAVLCLLSLVASAEPLPLWPNGPPGKTGAAGPERDTSKPGEGLVAGRTVIRLGDVSIPTVTLFPAPSDNNTGAAVVVCPGGGYSILAWDLEGTEVCDWLNSIGVTGILLKYRVPEPPGQPRYLAPLQDAQRALSLARLHAREWNIDSRRIGILGFSAGGHLSAAASCRFDQRAYSASDDADQTSCRPDFAILIYPAYLTLEKERDRLSPELTVSAQTPPTFLVQTEDDPVHVENSVYYALALKNAHVPVELHVFPKGGHGYGLRPTALPVTGWPKLAETWLRSNGWLKKP